MKGNKGANQAFKGGNEASKGANQALKGGNQANKFGNQQYKGGKHGKQQEQQICRGKTKKGKPCHNAAIKSGFCENHLQHQKKSFGTPSRNDGGQIVSQMVDRNTLRHQNLLEFQSQYELKGTSRVELAHSLAAASSNVLQRIVNERKLAVDVTQDRLQVASEIISQIECPELASGKSCAFLQEKLTQEMTVHQFNQCADLIKSRVLASRSVVGQLLIDSIKRWRKSPFQGESLGSGYIPLISGIVVADSEVDLMLDEADDLKHTESILNKSQIKKLLEMFSDFEHVFLLQMSPLPDGKAKFSMWLSNYISIDDWNMFFDFVLAPTLEIINQETRKILLGGFRLKNITVHK